MTASDGEEDGTAPTKHPEILDANIVAPSNKGKTQDEEFIRLTHEIPRMNHFGKHELKLVSLKI